MFMPPPPWADLSCLLRHAIYLYILLFLIALANAAFRRFTLTRHHPHYHHRLSAITRFIRRYRQAIILYGTYISALRMILSTFVCVSYVYVTYVGHISRPLAIALKSIGVILCLSITSVVITSDRPLALVTNVVSVVEVISLSSILFAKQSDWLNFSFLQAYGGVMSSYFALEPIVEVVFNFKWSQFQRQLARRAVEFVVFIYVFACGLQLFERMGEPWASFTATTFELTLANSFYFTVVTLFTVGYGDFVPFTLLGRIWIIFIIVFGAYLISLKIAQVIEVVSDLRRGRGSFVKAEETDHCVICGNVKWEYLKSFVEEFYQDERNSEKKLVVICDRPNWTEDSWTKFSFKNTHFRQHVVYLEGSCVSRDDLIRAQVETALAVFVLCNQHNPDPYGEDSETLKRILTIRSYTPTIPIYAMCALRDSMLQITFALEHLDENEVEINQDGGGTRRPSLDFVTQRRGNPFEIGGLHDVNQSAPMRDFSDDDDDDDGLLVHSYDGSSDLKSEAICMQEVEMSLMAENVFCNGLSTLLGNLILRIDPINKPTDQPWAVEYKIGSECRFEYVKLPMSLHNKKFGDIALVMYDYGVVLTATKRFMEQKWRAITPDHVFKINTVGLIITYHSAQFLDEIMGHIAERVERLFEESSEDCNLSSEQSFQLPDDDDDDDDGFVEAAAAAARTGGLSLRSQQKAASLSGSRLVVDTDQDISRSTPSYLRAGSFLAGDMSMTYDCSADELENENFGSGLGYGRGERNVAGGGDGVELLSNIAGSGSYGTWRHPSPSPPPVQQKEERQRHRKEEEVDNLRTIGVGHPLDTELKMSLSTEYVPPRSVLRTGTRSQEQQGIDDRGDQRLNSGGFIQGEQKSKKAELPRSLSAPLLFRTPSGREGGPDVKNSEAVAVMNLVSEAGAIVSAPHTSAELRDSKLELELSQSRALGGDAASAVELSKDVSISDGRVRSRRMQSVSPGRLRRVKNAITRHGSDSELEVDNRRMGVGGRKSVPDERPEELVSSLSVDMRLSRRKSHRVTFPSHPVSSGSGSGTVLSASKRFGPLLSGGNENVDGGGSREPGTVTVGGGGGTGSRLTRRMRDMNGPLYGRILYGDEELPMKIKGHIVVCAIGKMSVLNLKYFLQRVWTRRGSTDDDTPVVAIVPVVSEDDETELSTFEKKKLFLIQGNSLSVKTLKSAQFERAMAIVILACEDKTHVEEMDAKAMFTVMTLDYLLGELSETFVCTMLDAEESMQLLRAPSHARRKGANLGPHAEAYFRSWPGRSRSSRRSDAVVDAVIGSGSGVSGAGRSIGLRRSETESRMVPQQSDDFHLRRGMSFGMITKTTTLPKSMSFVGMLKNTYTNRRESIMNVVTRDPHSGARLGEGSKRYATTTGRRCDSRSGGIGAGASGGVSSSFLSFANAHSDDGMRIGGVNRSRRQGQGNKYDFGRGSERSMSHMSSRMTTTTGLGFEPSTLSFGGDLGTDAGAIGNTYGFGSSFGADGGVGGMDGGIADGAGENYARMRPRDESFEKQRYASGEIMISSTFMTLLIREYAMPGLTAIVRKIFGAGFGQHAKSKRSWIRTVSIPREWIESADNKQRVYRDVFERLLSLGAIAIGLYRAGDCNVRIEYEREDFASDGKRFDDDDNEVGGDEEFEPDFGGGSDVDDFGDGTDMDMDDFVVDDEIESGRMGMSGGMARRESFDNFAGEERRRPRRRQVQRSSDVDVDVENDEERREFEIGGDVVGGDERAFDGLYDGDGEQTRLISRRQTGAPQVGSSPYGVVGGGDNTERGERVSISSDVIEKVQREMEMEQQQQKLNGGGEAENEIVDELDELAIENENEIVDEEDEVEDDEDDFELEDAQKYTCENTGRVAYYEEVPGGGNVLPYVYANPEPYTLVSHLDAVYVLVAPHIVLPSKW